MGGDRTTVLTCDGQLLARLPTREAIRPDARREIEALHREGLEVWLLSGDAPERVAEVAAALGIPPERASSAMTPEEKAAKVAALDARDTLYLGDGVNDSLAFARAFSAGTPAIDRPVMPSRSDFFLLGEGIAPIRDAVHAARSLQHIVRRNLLIAVMYNAVAVCACLLGAMTPLRAAIAMPLSSLSILLLTAHALGHRSTTVRRLARRMQRAAA